MANSSMRMLSVHMGAMQSITTNGTFEEQLLQELGEDMAS